MKQPDNQQQLIEFRYPYASEAKDIIASRMVEKLEGWDEELAGLKAKCFKDLWRLTRYRDGHFIVERDFNIKPKTQLDDLIKGSLKQIYGVSLTEHEGKIRSNDICLSKIEGPTGENLIGASGKKCCFQGACIGCPQNRA